MTTPSGKSGLALVGGTIVTPAGLINNGVLITEASRIAGIGSREALAIPPGTRTVDVSGCQVLPGFIDTHVHGCHGDEVMAGDAAGIARMAYQFCRYGVTAFLPTTIAARREDLIRVIRAGREAQRIVNNPGVAPVPRTGSESLLRPARILGMHLEGPFLNVKRKGAQPEEGIRDPDLNECREYLELAPGFIRMMTLAPELPGAEDLIKLLRDHDVVASMGHTDADYATAARAIARGAMNATHLFNQMRPLHQRDPGIIAACLNHPEVTVELITDGVHLAPEIVELAVRAKGPEGVSLITDAIAALGMPDGEYHLGPHPVHVRDGRCTLADGTLAGSIHRMDRALSNTMRFSGASLAQASQMASAPPARTAGAADRKGTLEAGKDADVVVLREGEVQLTIVEGEIAYQIYQEGEGRE